MAWYKTDAGVPVGENRPVQKVVVAVTHMRYVKQNFGDRGSYTLRLVVQVFSALTYAKPR